MEQADLGTALAPRRTSTWVIAAVVLVLVAQLVHMLFTNQNFEWGVVAHYMFSPVVLKGLWATIWLTIAAMAVGIVLGGVLVAFRISSNPVLRSISSAYIWFFRGTPALVQLIFWFNIGLLLPVIGIGIPFGPVFWSAEANQIITPMFAAVIGMGFHEAAYQSEIYRAGLISVPPGQLEAARSLGMKPLRVFLRVQLPQAMRFIIPPTFSQIIGMTKGTALVSVIGGAELLFQVQQIYTQTYQTVPLLIVASIWYIVLTTILSIAQVFIEDYYGRGSGSRNALTTFRAVRDRWRTRRAVAAAQNAEV